MRRITLSSVVCPAVPYFPTLSHKRNDFREIRSYWTQKYVFIFSTTSVWNTSLFRIQRDITIYVHRSSCEVPVILDGFQWNLNFLDRFSDLKCQIWWKFVQWKKSYSVQAGIHWTMNSRVQLKRDGTRWRTGGEVKGKLANGVSSQYPSLPRNLVHPAILPLMRSTRLLVVDWTDAPADLNGLVRFAERQNLVSARVPSHFKRSLTCVISGFIERQERRNEKSLFTILLKRLKTTVTSTLLLLSALRAAQCLGIFKRNFWDKTSLNCSSLLSNCPMRICSKKALAASASLTRSWHSDTVLHMWK